MRGFKVSQNKFCWVLDLDATKIISVMFVVVIQTSRTNRKIFIQLNLRFRIFIKKKLYGISVSEYVIIKI